MNAIVKSIYSSQNIALRVCVSFPRCLCVLTFLQKEKKGRLTPKVQGNSMARELVKDNSNYMGLVLCKKN